jgi:hypothetical protein
MPWGDRTGPWGLGPMTGRAMGYCAGYPVPGFMNPGPWFGSGRGFGFGRGLGFGRGRGWRRGGFLPFPDYTYPGMSPFGYSSMYGYGYPFPYGYNYPYGMGYPPQYPSPEASRSSQQKK